MYEHRLAPRLLLRAFDSVLEARGLRCGARAAFCDAGFAQFGVVVFSNDSSPSVHFSTLGGSIFSEVVLARTRQKVLPGHFESDMTERGSFHTSPTY